MLNCQLPRKFLYCAIKVGLLVSLLWLSKESVAQQDFAWQLEEDHLTISCDKQPIAKYVFGDEKIPRPYWSDIRTLSGIQVTRNHPPRVDIDATDHEGLHTGIWLSFGDVSGNDYWRLKATTKQIQFIDQPKVVDKQLRFTVLNHYLASNDQRPIMQETCRYTLAFREFGYALEIESKFEAIEEVHFGDQEEMGLGIRVATPLVVDRKQGGQIFDSSGRRDGAEIWGKTADWCDYSGTIDNQFVGLTVTPSFKNFRPSWCHARDYGFLAMNPFGRKAFTGGEVSDVRLVPGEKLELGYVILVHASPDSKSYFESIPSRR